jgi:3-oxoacyl-[acyl-carrier protein] reductase
MGGLTWERRRPDGCLILLKKPPRWRRSQEVDMGKQVLERKTALVTGGTRGIGYSIAETLLKHGAQVFVCGTKQAGVDQAVSRLKNSNGNRIAGQTCDVRNYEQVKKIVSEAQSRFGGLDILINNAGIGVFERVEKMEPGDWRATLETNLSGVFYCCHCAIPLMKKRGGGYIINIGSLAGKNPFARGAAYNASKAGLIEFSEALMQEVRYDHIRVSYIMPGSVETEFGAVPGQSRSTQSWKLLPQDISAVVMNLLQSHPRSLSSRVEIRPSEPGK